MDDPLPRAYALRRLLGMDPETRHKTAGSGMSFATAGEHELKGVPDRWHLYRAAG